MKKIIDSFKRKIRQHVIIKKASCNICDKEFRVSSRYERFCRGCKRRNEVYRFAELYFAK